MRLLFINHNEIKACYFNQADSNEMLSLCRRAGKLWGDTLVGFFISENAHGFYCAANIKTNDDGIESMEYLDIETGQPEFQVDAGFIDALRAKKQGDVITLVEFFSLFECILHAPLKARRWEVYPVVNEHYQITH